MTPGFYLVLFSFCVAHVAFSADDEFWYTRTCGNDVMRTVGDVIEVPEVAGPVACCVLCADEESCSCFNYLADGRKCQLFPDCGSDEACDTVVPMSGGAYYQSDQIPKCANGGNWTGSECECVGSWVKPRCDVMARDCSELFADGRTHSDLYSPWLIRPDGSPAAFLAYCYLAWGGWTLFQLRRDGLEAPCTARTDFYRDWQDYKTGFGDPGCDWWAGNDNIHWLTTQKEYLLDVVMIDENHNAYQAHYHTFTVGNENTGYELSVGGYNVINDPIGDSLTPSADPQHNLHGMKFSTHDRDNDHSASNCAEDFQSGWWFNDCTAANPNGVYSLTGDGSRDTSVPSIMWKYDKESLGTRRFDLKIQPKP